MELRSDAFACIDALTTGLSSKLDIRAGQRAQRICDLAAGPILCGLARRRQTGETIRIADVGAGSGDLMRKIVLGSASRLPDSIAGRPFALTLVDFRLVTSFDMFGISHSTRCL